MCARVRPLTAAWRTPSSVPTRPDWRVLAGPAALALGMAPTGAALAHGFGQTYSLPVPLWLYLFGAAAAVVLSFVLVGFFHRRPHRPRRLSSLQLAGRAGATGGADQPITALRPAVISVLAFILSSRRGFRRPEPQLELRADVRVGDLVGGARYFTALSATSGR
ncbi:MAG: hypothetical protein WKH64_02520 [Chloroflexia bacterium]